MIIMLVDGLEEDRTFFTKPLLKNGISLIHYLNPVKAMDNLTEIQPDAIVFVLEDYPRHWKAMLKVVRETHSREQCPFLLLCRDTPDEETVHKAMYLGGNGFVRWAEESENMVFRILEILGRYIALPNSGSKNRYFTSEGSIVFSHPKTGALISGDLISFESNHLVIMPSNRKLCFDLEPGAILSDCSLQVEQDFMSVHLKVTKNTGNLIAEFTDMPEEEVVSVKDFLGFDYKSD
jgi:DNA-binding response OmpR family regulator